MLGLLLFDVLALVGGKVHTMVPGAEPVEATVLVDGDRIRAIGAKVELPADCTVVDCRGLHIVPGLIDGLAYHDPEHDLLYTAAGVTLIRDHGNELARIFDSRELAQREANSGPILSIAGGVIDGAPPATNAAVVVERPEQAATAIDRLVEEGIDFVAFHRNLKPDCWKALCEAAKKHQLAVWGPRLEAQTIEESLAGGQRGFVSLDSLLPKDRRWDQVETAELESAAKVLVQHGGALVPELRAYESRVEEQSDVSPELAHLGPDYASLWKADRDARKQGYTDELRRKAGVVIGKQRSLLLALHSQGVALVPGSGAPHPWLMPGEGLVRELVTWQSVGIPAADCLAYATRRAAHTLGLDAERGTIEANRIADLVVVRGDPSADVQALSNVEMVVLRGKLLDRATLDRKLSELDAKCAKAREDAERPFVVEEPKLPEGKVLLSGKTETTTAAGRIDGEAWAIVSEVDGTLTFCGRKRNVGSAGNADSFVEVRQRVRKSAFDSFEVKISSGDNTLVVEGIQIGGQWRVKRTLNGASIATQSAHEPLAAVDCGSVTTYLMLAQTRDRGHFPVMRFDEGLQPEVVRWDLDLDEKGIHAFKTPGGVVLAGFDSHGAITTVLSQVGTGVAQTMELSSDAHGGIGLPIPADKLARAKQAKTPDGK